MNPRQQRYCRLQEPDARAVCRPRQAEADTIRHPPLRACGNATAESQLAEPAVSTVMSWTEPGTKCSSGGLSGSAGFALLATSAVTA